MGDLSPNFSRYEFACRCGCGFDKPSDELVDHLQLMRDYLNEGITITSGCRCPAHNKQFGGLPEHEDGDGADLAVPTSLMAFKLMQAAYHTGFQRIGYGKKHGVLKMHVGVSKKLPTPRLWGY